MSYSNYNATPKDLKATEEGIRYAWHPKLNFIFKEKNKITDIIIISFDSKNLFVWKHKKSKIAVINQKKIGSSLANYELLTIPHSITIKENYQLGWRADFLLREKIPLDKMFDFPKENVISFQIISGSLLTPFISSQRIKTKTRPLNPYTTYESYLATIVHEFGHAYYNNFHTWWYSDKTESLGYLSQALELYQGKKTKRGSKLNLPSYDRRLILLSELFAFCTDYTAASFFWKNHKKDIDASNSKEIKEFLELEKNKNPRQEDSVLDPNPSAHTAALVFGKTLTTHHPRTWPEKILHANNLIL